MCELAVTVRRGPESVRALRSGLDLGPEIALLARNYEQYRSETEDYRTARERAPRNEQSVLALLDTDAEIRPLRLSKRRLQGLTREMVRARTVERTTDAGTLYKRYRIPQSPRYRSRSYDNGYEIIKRATDGGNEFVIGKGMTEAEARVCVDALDAGWEVAMAKQKTYKELFRVGEDVEVAHAPRDGESEPAWERGRVARITTHLHVAYGRLDYHMAYLRADYNRGLIRKVPRTAKSTAPRATTPFNTAPSTAQAPAPHSVLLAGYRLEENPRRPPVTTRRSRSNASTFRRSGARTPTTRRASGCT